MKTDSKAWSIYIKAEIHEDEKWHFASWAADYWNHNLIPMATIKSWVAGTMINLQSERTRFHHDCCSHVSLLQDRSCFNRNSEICCMQVCQEYERVSFIMLNKICHTELGENNEVLRVALWAGDARCAVATLFLVHPALQTRLVNPLSGTTTTARTHPLRRPVVLVCGETHPTTPATNTHTSALCECSRNSGQGQKTERSGECLILCFKS